MDWRKGRRSSNVEDRRGRAPRTGFRLPRMGRSSGGFGGRRPRMGKRAGIGGLGFIILIVVMLFLGVDPSVLLQGMTTGMSPTQQMPAPPQSQSPEERELVDFVSVVLGDTEDTWRVLFEEMGGTYREPTLVLFSGLVQSACGLSQAASGPFYCPLDQKVYIDLSFYDELKTRFRAPGDFAQAYVIAHEVGHHVQTLLGITEKVMDYRRSTSQEEGNKMLVRQELQADCLAGIWAHHADRSRQLLETGDIEEGLTAASAIGDDRLQKQAQGYVVPESFTHGTSEQRVRWFKKGFESGDPGACDTFSASSL